MTDTNPHRFNDCRVICFGGVKPTDTHLAVAIHRVNQEIIGGWNRRQTASLI
jgi:hypothetical protein